MLQSGEGGEGATRTPLPSSPCTCREAQTTVCNPAEDNFRLPGKEDVEGLNMQSMVFSLRRLRGTGLIMETSLMFSSRTMLDTWPGGVGYR